jgi:hypothetical protein
LKTERGGTLTKAAEIKGIKNIFAFSLHTPLIKYLGFG